MFQVGSPQFDFVVVRHDGSDAVGSSRNGLADPEPREGDGGIAPGVWRLACFRQGQILEELVDGNRSPVEGHQFSAGVDQEGAWNGKGGPAIENGTLLDTERMEIVGERHVTIEGDRIVDVDTSTSLSLASRARRFIWVCCWGLASISSAQRKVVWPVIR